MQNNPFANVKLRKTTQPVERGLTNFLPEPTQPHIPPPPGSQPNTSNIVTSQPTSSGHIPLPPSSRSPIQQQHQHVPTSSSVFSNTNVPIPPGGQPVKPSMLPVSNNSVSSHNSSYCPPPPNMQKTKVSSSSPATSVSTSHIPQPPPGSVPQKLEENYDDELEKLLAELKTSTNENVPLPPGSQPPKPKSVATPVSSFTKRSFVPPIPNAKTEPKTLEFYQQLCESVKEKKTGLEFKDIPKCTYQCKKYNSVGASDIDISVDETKLNQIVKPIQQENDDGVAFCFIVSFTLENTQKYPVVMNHCELQYQDSNGKWIRAKSNYLCFDKYWDTKETITSNIFGVREWENFSVKGVFPSIPNISATTLHKYEFISHPTLPQPLQLKIVIGDKFGATKELQIEQFNFIPQIPQDAYSKIIEKSSMEPLARYVFCEDLNDYYNMKFMKFALVDNKLYISFHDIERNETSQPKIIDVHTVELNKTDIQEFERKSRTGLNEINYPFNNYAMKHVTVKITFLFNDGHLYGARVFMDTCSHTIEKVVYLRDFIRVVIF